MSDATMAGASTTSPMAATVQGSSTLTMADRSTLVVSSDGPILAAIDGAEDYYGVLKINAAVKVGFPIGAAHPLAWIVLAAGASLTCLDPDNNQVRAQHIHLAPDAKIIGCEVAGDLFAELPADATFAY